MFELHEKSRGNMKSCKLDKNRGVYIPGKITHICQYVSYPVQYGCVWYSWGLKSNCRMKLHICRIAHREAYAVLGVDPSEVKGVNWHLQTILGYISRNDVFVQEYNVKYFMRQTAS